MKVLFLVQKDQRAILDRLYEGVAAHCDCDIRWLSSDEQRHLRRYFHREVDVSRYDRIVFFLRFKQEIRQVSFIRTLPNLVILERGRIVERYQSLMNAGVRVQIGRASCRERV